jgi:hypothetical protein
MRVESELLAAFEYRAKLAEGRRLLPGFEKFGGGRRESDQFAAASEYRE